MKKTMNIQLMILGLALCVSPGMVSRAQTEADGASHEGHAHNTTEDNGSKQTQRIPVTQEQVARLGIKITRAIRGVVRKENSCSRGD